MIQQEPTDWIVPRNVDTPAEFETWTMQEGISYTGTAEYNSTTHIWNVQSWTRVEPGSGGSTTRSSGAAPPPSPQADTSSATTPAPDPTTNPLETLRQGIIGANQPRLSTGGTAPGNLHLYSGPSGDTAARSAASGGDNYYLRDTPHYTRADTLEQGLQARMGRPLDYMTEARPIWDEASRDLVREATLGARGVESHGLDTYEAETGRPTAKTTQVMEEIPTALRYGGATALLGVASGGFTIWAASYHSNAAVRGVGYVSGGGEIVGGGIYGYGLYQLSQTTAGSATTMASGALTMRVFGGTGLIIMSSANLGEHLQSGEYGLTVGDGAGVVGGFGIWQDPDQLQWVQVALL